MRISTVCCARTPNLEIAIFSGDFVPAGGALPWRRQDGAPQGRKGEKNIFSINYHKHNFGNTMKVQYLGTGAAEGVPAVFCNCEYCRGLRARMAAGRAGREVRSRSQVI